MDIVEKVIYIISSHDNPDTIWKEQRNSLYSENKNGTIFFNSKKIKKYIFKIKWIKLNLDETLAKKITFLSIKDAAELSEKSIERNIDTKSHIEVIVVSEIHKVLYKYSSTFNFVFNIFIKSLMKHCLTNGNKRFSLAFLSQINIRNVWVSFFWTRDSKKRL